MNGNSILAKTAKGQEELDSRKHGLPTRLRAALIMADGQTELATLLERCGEFAKRVELQFVELMAGGFVKDIAVAPGIPGSVAKPGASAFPSMRDLMGAPFADEPLPLEATRELTELFVEKLDGEAIAYVDGLIQCETSREVIGYLEKSWGAINAAVGPADANELLDRVKEVIGRYS